MFKKPKAKFCKICGIEHRNMGSTCGRPQCEKTRKERKEAFRKEIRESGEAIVASLKIPGKIGFPKIRPVDTTMEPQEKKRKPKKCKVCQNEHYNIGSTCGRPQCEATRKAEKEKNKKTIFIRPVESDGDDGLAQKRKLPDLRKNTVREVTAETKRIVLERDGGQCVIGKLFPELRVQCDELEGVPHHVFYGSDANYGGDRNNETQLVSICNCHHRGHIHGGTSDDGPMLREATKEYLYTIYGRKNYPSS